jgi:hypothetical protein
LVTSRNNKEGRYTCLQARTGRWSDDDYDVLENGVVVGRIFKVPVPPQDRPWMWASGHSGEIRRAAHGYEPAHEAAMAAFLDLASLHRPVPRN